MLRALVALLLVANLGFFAWTQGWLDAVVGVRAIGDREPERLQRQVRPEAIRLLPAAAASEVGAAEVGANVGATSAAATCFEAGPFADAEWGAAQIAARNALPAGAWAAVDTAQAGTWSVYMGRYASREALTRKTEELGRRQLPYDEVKEPAALAPGLSLGRFDQRNTALQALDRFVAQGVRTARVVELVPPATRHMLRVERADADLSKRLVSLRLAPLAPGFAPCAKPAGA